MNAIERLCRHCGDPLPPQKGRSRPRVAHAGECSRKYHNKRRLNWRIERFRAAHRADRSDELPWAASRYSADDYDPEGFSTSRGQFDDVHGPALIAVMNKWEAAETARRRLIRAAWADYEDEIAEGVARLGRLPEDERRARLDARRAEWAARYGGELQAKPARYGSRRLD